MNMYNWVRETIEAHHKQGMPILTFPAVSLLNVKVSEITHNSDLQAQGIIKIAQRCNAGAAVSFMDLSVEAEAFGSTIVNSDDEVPTVTGTIFDDVEEVYDLEVPEVGVGRTGMYIKAIGEAACTITDRPVFAGCIGPFSLAGRLMGMEDIMVNCYDEEEATHALLEKCSEFIEKYILAFKKAGADGIVIAEPVAGLLSPALMMEFSGDYLRKIIEKVQDENFIVIYHNCGNYIGRMCEGFAAMGAKGYHFGNSEDMLHMLEGMPDDVLVMGNVDPAGVIRGSNPEVVRATTLAIMEKCCGHPNFVISSGCDIPPATPWENIDAFFAAVDEFNAR